MFKKGKASVVCPKKSSNYAANSPDVCRVYGRKYRTVAKARQDNAALMAFRWLPNRKVNRFWNLFGEIKRLTFHCGITT